MFITSINDTHKSFSSIRGAGFAFMRKSDFVSKTGNLYGKELKI